MKEAAEAASRLRASDRREMRIENAKKVTPAPKRSALRFFGGLDDSIFEIDVGGGDCAGVSSRSRGCCDIVTFAGPVAG